MIEKTVWKKTATGLALLAIASGAWADEFDFFKPDADPPGVKNVDPDDYYHLDGVWWCHFLKYRGRIERDYYSVWTFDPARKAVVIFFSPVHKGVTYDYRWDGKPLRLDHPWGPAPRLHFGTYQTQIRLGGTLVIEDPRFRGKGWRCNHQPGVRWPADGLQFLDYSRYPWLSGLVEDGGEIMKYQNPKPYEEWRQRQTR